MKKAVVVICVISVFLATHFVEAGGGGGIRVADLPAAKVGERVFVLGTLANEKESYYLEGLPDEPKGKRVLVVFSPSEGKVVPLGCPAFVGGLLLKGKDQQVKLVDAIFIKMQGQYETLVDETFRLSALLDEKIMSGTSSPEEIACRNLFDGYLDYLKAIDPKLFGATKKAFEEAMRSRVDPFSQKK